MCRRLTQLMAGSLEVSSKPGEGSTFRIELVLDTDPAPAEPPTPQGRMLVASANAGHCAYLAWLATQHGVQADSAATLADACAVAEQRSQRELGYAWIVLDWDLGGPDGVAQMCAAAGDAAVASLISTGERRQLAQHTGLLAGVVKLSTPPRATDLFAVFAAADAPLAVGSDELIGEPRDIETLLVYLDAHAARVQAVAPGHGGGSFDVTALMQGQSDQQRQLLLDTIDHMMDVLPADLAALQGASAASAPHQAKAILHRLRGSIGTLGARRFVAAALQLEAQLTGNMPIEQGALCQVERELAQTQLAANVWRNAQRASGPNRPRQQASGPESLGQLVALLEAQDLDACGMFSEMRGPLAQWLGSVALDEMEQHVRALAFAEALLVLRAAQESRSKDGA